MPGLKISALDPALVAAAVEALAEGVLLLDADGAIVFANRAFSEGLGVAPERIIGLRWDDPTFKVTDLAGQQIPAEKRAFRQVLANGKPVLGYEYIVYHVSGRPVRVRMNAVPVWEDERLAGVAVTMVDITESKAAEDTLREREAMLRAFVDQSRYGLFISSVEGEVILYNRAMETITGYTYEEVKARGWLEVAFPDPEDRKRAAEQALRQLSGEVPYIEEQYTRKDGTQIWVSSAVSPVRLYDRDLISGILIDITDRMQAQEKVRYQASLIENARNAVIATDSNGCVNYVNEPAERLFGWSPGEAIGQDVIALTAPDTPGTAASALLEHVAIAGRWEGEATVRRPDGEDVPVMLALGSVPADGDERPAGFVGVATDLTDVKAAQRALEEKDRAIRQAYVDVVSAVTGGKLVLMTEEELSAALGRPIAERLLISYETLSQSRKRVLEVMRAVRTRTQPEQGVVAFGEAATNALKHAGGGRCELFAGAHTLQVLVSDDGGGIDFRVLPHATLMAGFSTKQTLGMGFTIMLELADRLLLATRPGCTKLVLEFNVLGYPPDAV